MYTHEIFHLMLHSLPKCAVNDSVGVKRHIVQGQGHDP